MSCVEREGLFGGAAAGGKSDALLMDVLQYADAPSFSALLIRKTFSDLNKADALIPRAMSWLTGTGAHRREGGKIWEFPSGARLEFGHLENKDDELNYQGGQFNYIGFDELTQHDESQYLYLFSRLRKSTSSAVPSKMRATTNPGGPGHDWVRSRFIDGFDGKSDKFAQDCSVDMGEPYGTVEFQRFFVPSFAKDNPSLDLEDYLLSLANLTPIAREQLLRGDWDISPTGAHFRMEWFEKAKVLRAPEMGSYIRAWDTSLTVEGDPTASSLLMPCGRDVYLLDQTQDQTDVPGLLSLIVKTSKRDPEGTMIAVEDSSVSKPVIWQLKQRSDLDDRRVISVPVSKITGPRQSNDKLSRASAWMNKLADGELKIVEGAWNDRFVSQCLRFTNSKTDKDDLIDSMSVGYSQIFKQKGRTIREVEHIEVGSPRWYNDEIKRRRDQSQPDCPDW